MRFLIIFFFSFPLFGIEIAFFTKTSFTWDPRSIETGIAGSEEAVIYLGQELAALGYQVTVYGNPPSDSPYTSSQNNPRYLPYHQDEGKELDIAIAWRDPAFAPALKQRAKKVYLWPHDTAPGHFADEQIASIDGVLWLSQWQREQWVSLNPELAKFKKIFGNGIEAKQFQPIEARKNPYACIYASNYARGLEELLDIWPQVKRAFPKATLDIYYGWQHWGLLTLQKEKFLREKVAHLGFLDVKEHGKVGHEELNRAYARASFWTYPCTMPETFCISALRAQLSGAVPVVILQTALPETVRFGFACTTCGEYLPSLMMAMQRAEQITLEERQKMGEFILQEYTWKIIAAKWHAYFNS